MGLIQLNLPFILTEYGYIAKIFYLITYKYDQTK